ncbi:MAG: hypothetical protein ACLP4V_27510 [Methylocella sp.]
MGEAKGKLSATQKFVEEFPVCFFCGGKRASTTREHMPPKSLFDNSHRPDKLVMPACKQCNSGTSTADLTAAVVSRWHYDIGESERLDHRRLVAQMRKQAPALSNEWGANVGKEEARQHLRKYGVPVPHDAGIATIGPETIRQLNLFAHKAVLALYFEHFQKALPISGGFCAYWKTKEDFARDGIPSYLLEIMPDYGTLIQGQWDERETFEYRHAVNAKDGLFACLAKLRKGLFVAGIAATDGNVLSSEIVEWLHPDDPQTLLELPRFQKKL